MISDNELENPDFEYEARGGKWVHNWQGHVGARTRAIWMSLPIQVRRAIAEDAQEEADREEWD